MIQVDIENLWSSSSGSQKKINQ